MSPAILPTYALQCALLLTPQIPYFPEIRVDSWQPADAEPIEFTRIRMS